MLFRNRFRAFFVYGFAKSDRENIEDWELRQYRKTARDDFALSDKQIETLLKKGTFIEVV